MADHLFKKCQAMDCLCRWETPTLHERVANARNVGIEEE